MSQIECSKHGIQDETFVCQHIVQGLEENKANGFHYPADLEEERPNAWCSKCNDLVKNHNWNWTEEVLEVAQIKILCATCYDQAKVKNGL
jgi:Zn finger protein HypA/HybF involved in hydrogenase expression